VLLQVLGIFEGLPIDAERDRALEESRLARELGGPPRADPAVSPRLVHWLIEALRRAFADRAEHMGDPGYYDVPVDQLLSPEWIAERRVSIGERADPDVGPWEPAGAGAPRESSQTTHLSVLDREGNAVSLTTTLNGSFGSGVMVESAGFLLNDEIDDFALVPDSPNMFGLVGGAANAIRPGKRPLSSMTPTVVRDGGHTVALVIGSPGGPRIITAVLEVLLRVLALGQPLEEAVRAPRVHQQWKPAVTLFERGWSPELLAALKNRHGQEVEVVDETFGSVQAIHVPVPGGDPVAISDPRRTGQALVEPRPKR
jgi:gamma-glutamyltranspeptidase / glutathione hydrolase